jgi:hypothetical protein
MENAAAAVRARNAVRDLISDSQLLNEMAANYLAMITQRYR